jgi:BirA family biotin operon repressor/biotin-[acetyl-CoA-carboxylase] ligase
MLAIAGASHGTLVTAAEQTAGRGRQGRSWVAPSGSALLCSLVLRDAPSPLSLIAAVAVCDVVGESARVKWPNDVVVPPRFAKLAGVLVEGRPQEGWAVLGIGLNVAVPIHELPSELRGRAASLELPSSAIEPLTARLMTALEHRLADSTKDVLDAWRKRDALLDRHVSWSQGEGTAHGIDDSGRLIVALADGSTRKLDAGEVHLGTAL